MLNRTSNDESTLRLTQTGGLNTETSSASLPYKDASVLINFDVTPTGKLVKRRGTRSLVLGANTEKFYATQFSVTPRVGLVVLKSGTTLNVYHVYDDTSTLLLSSQVFKAGTESNSMNSVVVFDGEIPSILLLVEGSAPIQLFAHVETSLGHTGTSYTYLSSVWSTYRTQTAYAFEDGAIRTPASFGSSSVTNLTSSEKDLDIIALRWYWWAEAETWYGQDFYQTVSRFGDSQTDQHVTIPTELRSDLERGSSALPWKLYYSDQSTDMYTNDTTGTPSRAYEYSFSDGTNYNPETSDTPLKPSSLFATFGRNNFLNKQLILDKNINSITDTIELDNHGYITGDEVKFDLGEDGVMFPGLSAGTTYYVYKVDEGSFKLYTNSTLTTLVNLTDRTSKSFNNYAIQYGDSSISIAAHGFSNRDRVVLGSDLKLPAGLSNTVKYYVSVLDANRIKLYFDNLLRYTVSITAPAKIFLTSLSYNTTTNQINTGATALLDGDGVRFYTNGGSLPTGLTAGVLYYVRTVSSTTIEVYTNAALTADYLVDFGGTPGNTFMIPAPGTHTVTVDTGSVFLERVPYDTVGISRRRRLSFNNYMGITPSKLAVTVDSVSYNLTGSPTYTGYSSINTTTVNPNGILTYLGFETTPVGLSRVSRVRLVNTDTAWVGAAGVSTVLQGLDSPDNSSGRCIPMYGFGRFANYATGAFPTVGELIQGRLVLAGFHNKPGLVLFSSVSDSKFSGEFFNFFQITDALEGLSVDPFDLNIVGSSQSLITALITYQSSLFVFTADTAYRLRSADAVLTSSTASLFTIAHQGAVNSNCVARSENSVVMVSSTGLYDINLALEDSFLSSELSNKISRYFKPLADSTYHKLPWILYDNITLRFYIALPEDSRSFNEKLLVFDIRTSSWTEYISYAGFQTYSGFVYRDNLLGRQFAITGRTLCNSTITRLNYPKSADYIIKYTSVPPQAGLPPTFEYQLTYANVIVYEFDFYELPFVNYNSFTLKLVSNLDASTINAAAEVGYTRVNADKLTVRLNSNPGNSKYLVLQKETRVMWVDNIQEVYNSNYFSVRADYSNICSLGT